MFLLIARPLMDGPWRNAILIVFLVIAGIGGFICHAANERDVRAYRERKHRERSERE